MSVRFDTAGENYTATNGMPAGNVYTVICWVRLAVDRDTYQTVWVLDVGSATTGIYLETNSDGTTLGVWSSASATAQQPISLAVDTWYQTAVVVNGTTVTHYREAAGNTLTSGSVTLTGANPPTRLIIGDDGGGTAWLNGNVANFKVYGAALSQSEIEAELASWTAVRTSNLLRHHKFQTAEATDYSGNGNSLSGGTGTSTEGDPPINVGSLRLPIQTIQVP